MWDVFISHASEDKESLVRELARELDSRGIRVWYDEHSLSLGDSLRESIDRGLANSRYGIVVLSASFFEKRWPQKELGALAALESSGAKKILPIWHGLGAEEVRALSPLLADRVAVSSTLGISGIADAVERELRDKAFAQEHLEQAREKESAVSEQVISGLALLLLLDRYPMGVWGRSLAATSGDYGHKEDPGSITASGWAVEALLRVFDEPKLPEAEEFINYILERRKTINGAIGMRKSIGSDWAQRFGIIENRRHTATGAHFLKSHSKHLDLALASLRYVIESRTSSGAWSATGDLSDENADPLTTAYVLRTLRDFEKEGLLQNITFNARDEFLATYWTSGLSWLHKNLIRNGYFWLYCSSGAEPTIATFQRKHCFTAAILLALYDSVGIDANYDTAHSTVMANMMGLWRANGVGISYGEGAERPSLEATVEFARACWKSKAAYPRLAEESKSLLLQNLECILSECRSDSAGWAMTLSYLTEDLGQRGFRSGLLEDVRILASEVWDIAQESGVDEALDCLSDYPPWVQGIATNRILRVTIEPP